MGTMTFVAHMEDDGKKWFDFLDAGKLIERVNMSDCTDWMYMCKALYCHIHGELPVLCEIHGPGPGGYIKISDATTGHIICSGYGVDH